jgi:hypothetical protein
VVRVDHRLRQGEIVKLIKGDLWSELGKADVILVTTNSVIGRNGLVMGAGAAQQASTRYPQLPRKLATRISGRDDPQRYGIALACKVDERTWLGAFQTKQHWNSPSDLLLIKQSTRMLKEQAEKHPDWRFALNYPGIGLGGLPVSQVQPILEQLPNNVIVYRR